MVDEETKICPFCGEEILAIAKKCKHCGEFLIDDNINSNNSNDRIENAEVNDKWKERFRIVDVFVLDGMWWKGRPEYWKSSLSERLKYSCKLYFSDIGSFIATLLFGGFYYLFKGMWLKFIIYGIFTILTGGIFWVIFPCWAPFDYYRYKVLGKQW